MNLTLYKMKLVAKKKGIQLIRWTLQPVGYFFTKEKIDARYKKKRDKITEEQAVRWIAEDMARYIIKYKEEVRILICNYANEDHFWSGCRIDDYYFKRNKTYTAYYKFNKTIAFQEKVIETLKNMKEFHIVEQVDTFKWERIENYQKTVIITP